MCRMPCYSSPQHVFLNVTFLRVINLKVPEKAWALQLNVLNNSYHWSDRKSKNRGWIKFHNFLFCGVVTDSRPPVIPEATCSHLKSQGCRLHLEVPASLSVFRLPGDFPADLHHPSHWAPAALTRATPTSETEQVDPPQALWLRDGACWHNRISFCLVLSLVFKGRSPNAAELYSSVLLGDTCSL